MTSDVDVSAGTSMRLYARFSRRLKGLFIDWLLALIVIYCGLSLSIAIGSDDFSRFIGFPIVAALLLYEPVMVSRTGGTIGHHFTNLRVVDEITHDNISFFKAAARSLIKNAWLVLISDDACRKAKSGGARFADGIDCADS